MSTDTTPVLQAALGINNVDDPKAAVFQPSQKGNPQFLTKAQNVDLDKEGYVRRRVGRTKRLALSSAHSLFADSKDRLFLVNSGELLEVFPDYTVRPIDADLGNHPLSYVEAAGQVFYANETKVGVIDGFWGVKMPSPPFGTLSSGNMSAGRYLVAVTALREGVESGARQPTVAELINAGGLSLSVAGFDPNADALNVYCSEPNGQELYWQGEFPPTSPIHLTQVQHSTDPLTTFGHYPPLPGQHIANYRGRMLIASGAALYWSQPLAYHHFRIQTDVQLFEDRICLLAALDSGFFVAAGSRTYWVAGQDPDEWQPRLIDTRQVAEGQPLRLPAHKLPELQSQGEVLVWATADGFVAGMGDGTVQHLTDGRLAIDAFKQSALTFREDGNLRQILLSLQTKESDSRFGVTDRMGVKVIRANEHIGEP